MRIEEDDNFLNLQKRKLYFCCELPPGVYAVGDKTYNLDNLVKQTFSLPYLRKKLSKTNSFFKN